MLSVDAVEEVTSLIHEALCFSNSLDVTCFNLQNFSRCITCVLLFMYLPISLVSPVRLGILVEHERSMLHWIMQAPFGVLFISGFHFYAVSINSLP